MTARSHAMHRPYARTPADRRAQSARMNLAPLDPDRFLAWAWRCGRREKGTHPLTVADLAFELGIAEAEVRRSYVRIAATVRRNQRLGCEPFEGIAR